jgi:hypothetical protein
VSIQAFTQTDREGMTLFIANDDKHLKYDTFALRDSEDGISTQ